jgi:hypothetical protein
MAAKGYTTRALVAAYLGKDLTVEQQRICDLRIEEAESLIDDYLGQAWFTGAITDEFHELYGPLIHLNNRPVSSIQGIIGRVNYSATETALVVDEDYFIASFTRGIVQVSSFESYDWVLVDYTPASPIPKKLQLGTTMLVAKLMGNTIDPNRNGIQSYSVGEDLTVKYRDPKTWDADIKDVLETMRTSVGVS